MSAVDPDGDGEIQFFDVAPPLGEAKTETVTTPSRRGGGVLAAGVVIAVGLGIAGLASGGGDNAAAPAESTTTTQPEELPSTDVAGDDSSEGPPPGSKLELEIGAGPPLEWRQVPFDIAATDFAWVDGRFVGSDVNGRVAVVPSSDTIRLASVSSIFDGPPVDSSRQAESDGGADPNRIYFTRLFEAGFQWPPRSIQIEPLLLPQSDLITTDRSIAAELRGNDVLVLQQASAVLDVDEFRSRTGIVLDPIFGIEVDATSITVFGDTDLETVSISDADLSAVDIEALRSIQEPVTQVSIGPLGGRAEATDVDLARIDWIAVVGDEFLVGGNELRRSSNGTEWEDTSGDTPRLGGLRAPGEAGLVLGLAFEGETGFVATSADAGRSWPRIANPLENTWQLAAASPVLALTGWSDAEFTAARQEWTILTPEYELRIDEANENFELLDRAGNSLLNGSLTDPDSGVRAAPGSLDIWFADPATGEVITRIPQELFSRSLAAAQTQAGNPQMVALADLSQPGNVQEWFVTPVNELFGPEALAVDFTPGDGWLLASVITETGRDLYVAELPTVDSTADSLPAQAEITEGEADS